MHALKHATVRRLGLGVALSLALGCAAHGAPKIYAPRLQTACPVLAAFAKLHPNPIYDSALMGDVAGVTDMELRRKILALYAIDDHSRKTDDAIKELIDAYGFPTERMVGVGGVWAAFDLVQHADLDPAFQRATLQKAQRLYEQHKVPGPPYAYLVDRVRVAEGKKQVFGTQFAGARFQAVGGHLTLRPVEAPSGLDARRKAAGLAPEAAYVCYVEYMSGYKVVPPQR